jgi:molybdopterin-guanine dinucleotide biosynthesis protein A
MAIPIDRALIEGFVLAGGASSRFGSDKATAVFDGRPLLDRAIDAIRSLGLAAAIVGPGAARYGARADRCVTGERPGLGPAEGLRTALESCAAPWAVVLSVDMPLVDGAILRSLCAAAHPEDRAVCFLDSSGLRHPFPGLYRRELAERIAAQPAPLSLQRVLDAARARGIATAAFDPGGSFLLNVNRPEDLPS